MEYCGSEEKNSSRFAFSMLHLFFSNGIINYNGLLVQTKELKSEVVTMDKKEQIKIIQEDFKNAQSILTAIGDETRQVILMVLMESDCKTGMRVGEITEKTHLSRPAVSHQLKILKDIGIVRMREEGTKNYYYINVSEKLNILKKLVLDIEDLVKEL